MANLIPNRPNLPQQGKAAILSNNSISESEKNSSAATPNTCPSVTTCKEEHSTNRTNTRSPSKRDLCETSFDLDKRARIQKQRSGTYSSNSYDSTSTPSNRYNSTHAYEPKSQITTSTTASNNLSSAAMNHPQPQQ